MNNATFGKTMENCRKYRRVKLLKSWDGRYDINNFIASPLFHFRTIFDENLVAVEFKRTEIVSSKSLYIGMAILDISKTIINDFH